MPSSHDRLVARAFSVLTRFRALVLGAAFLIAGQAVAVPVEVTVMTRNLYFGADTSAILAAPNAAAIPAAVKAAFAQAKSNDFNVRVEGIADEIQQASPHLIGLQEAVLINAISATTGALTYSRDFVQILVSELASRGLNYVVAATHTGFDSILPSGGTLLAPEEAVRLTDREVILRRSDVTVTGTKEATFVNDVTLLFAGGPFKFNRGYVAVDAAVGGIPFRFVSTHLDELESPLQPLQLGEILAATGDAQRLILVGDFNSAADGSSTPTYANALAAGFADVWAALGAGPGFTCCENPGLDNPTPLLDNRIDYILHRGAILDALAVDLVGDIPFRSSAPFYASDHAGLIAIFAVDIPEPGMLVLLGAGIVGWGWAAQRRRRASVLVSDERV
jgi:hypothetical protein